MARKDLIALSPESIGSLSNMGMVKRMQREIAEGAIAKMEAAPDGTVVGTYKDGIVAKLFAGKTLKECACSCPATTLCRHRVGVALAYKAWYAEQREGPPSSVRAPAEWSPSEITDEQLEKALGKKTIDRAKLAMRGGVLVTLERGQIPSAKLPSCTVRFLVPRDVAYAKCDCKDSMACEHIALSVWAFRDAGDFSDATIVISLGKQTAKADARAASALEDAQKLAATVLEHGVAELPPGLTAKFAAVRSKLDDEGLVWPCDIVVDLEQTLEAYAKRSALYSTSDIMTALTELEARVRAASSECELPPRFILGSDEKHETLLDHLRLVSFGARTHADERTRFADVFLADSDSCVVLVLRKQWDYAEKETPEEGPALARRNIATKVVLGSLASGQLVSKTVKRHANRSMGLGTSRTAPSSVTPQRGDWDSLPSPLLVRDLEAYEQYVRKSPPKMLRPRVLAEHVHAVAVKEVARVVYLPADQELLAELKDEKGASLWASVKHRNVAPHAIDAASEAFSKPVRFVAGELRFGKLGLEIDVTAIVTDTIVVPDLASKPAKVPEIERATAPRPTNPVDEAVGNTASVLEEIVHLGLRGHRNWGTRSVQCAARLENVGLLELARSMRRLESSAKIENTLPVAHEAWLDAAIHMTLLRESL